MRTLRGIFFVLNVFYYYHFVIKKEYKSFKISNSNDTYNDQRIYKYLLFITLIYKAFINIIKTKNNKIMITNIIKYAVSIPEIDDATDIENSINIFEIFIEKIKKYNIKIDNFHILIPLIHAAIYYQKMSILQKYDKINLKTIQMITSKKGGYTMLVMSKILYGEYEQYYDTLIYELGHYIQLTNDVFDIYKDLQEGVKTMANQTDIFTFEAYYLDCYDKLIKLKILQNNKLNNVKLLIYFIQIITTFHIRKIKNLNEKNYTILSRNIIVTDMEKPLVFLKFCIYALSNFSKL